MEYNGIKIEITFNPAESEQHLAADLQTVMDAGVENLAKEKFIPWLLGSEFQDRDADKVLAGLKLYEINYHYGKIVAKYSPTGEDNYFGQFEFCFESGSDYTKDILQAVAMQIYVLDDKIVKVSGYDI